MTTVFFLGATGYIGGACDLRETHRPGLSAFARARQLIFATGAVLSALLKAHPTLSVTALVRRLGVVERLVERHARAADVVVNAACSDDLALLSAILVGQRKRVEVDGRPRGALVHTSGGAISLDPSRAGAYDLNGEIWNDSNPADVRALTTSMVQGQVDIPILQAGEEGYVETHVIFPGGIVGEAHGPVLAGSVFLKLLIQLSTERQRACYFGEGTNMLYLADVNDLADLYLRVFDRVLTGADKDASPYERYYIGAAIGESLARRTLLEDGIPESIAVDQVPDPWVPPLFLRGCVVTDSPGPLRSFSHMWASTQRLEPTRGKRIGWNPKSVDIREFLNESIDAALDTIHRKL
ncbi:hypothetical protein EDB87DRAFT_1687887 [Lactarius vividus]|nr:hypothetical protein EDB87DRAFT_1687887 [Lactarius vividus]